jgi:glutamyl-tRNA reductase
MQYLVISFSHKNTDVVVRERLALDEKTKESVAKNLLNSSVVNELILLSTCNRVEVIASVKDSFEATKEILKEISGYSNLEVEELKARADIYEDNGAIYHIFSVASGLDSLVVGETQISGQLKDAYKEAYEKGWCSQKLGRVMHYAFKCSAEVRNKTDISKNPVSVASAAVAMAEDIFSSLRGMKAVVVGAGEMGVLATKHLLNRGCGVVLVGRDVKKTQKIADEIDESIEVKGVGDLKNLINSFRLLFSATSSKEPVIDNSMVEMRDFKRVWFDMAIPRDIDVDIENIDVYAVDDLRAIVDKNLALREEQAKEAYKIVGKYVDDFYRWLQSLEIEPIIKEIRNRAKEAALKEIQKAIKKGYIDPKEQKNIEKLIHNAFNQFLHTPTKRLKSIADEPKADTIVESIKFFFDIDEDVGLNRYKCEYYMNLRS